MTETFSPASEKDTADIIRGARDGNRSIRIVAGGSRSSLGQSINTDLNIVTTQLSGIVHYNPGALSLVVQAGTPLSEVNEVLAAEKQRLAFEPIDYRDLLATTDRNPTIGGVVACGISGPRRIRVGACRDALLGVRFVNGKGEIIKNGGQVMKNVTGYDLVKFLCGSYGTLGVLTELSFKTAPLPETEGSFLVTGMNDENAVSLMSKALGLPLDVTGAAHYPGQTCIRIEGQESMVKTRLQKIQDLFEHHFDANLCTTSTVYDEDSRNLWKDLRDVNRYKNADGDVWRISLRPTDGPIFVNKLSSLMPAEGYYDWGGGLIWLKTDPATPQLARTIRETLAPFGGHATLIRSSADARKIVPVFQPEHPALAALARRVKREFDPASILNPGLMKIEGAT